jgi:SM-20-related protein
MIDLLEIADFLDAGACARLRDELRAAPGAPATLLGRDTATAVAPQVRRTTRAALPAEMRVWVTGLLIERKQTIEEHFGLALGECEEPQFLRYQPGDFFVAHQDGNTPLVHDDSRFRKISAVIFLSTQADEPAPETYGGGSFVFHGPYSARPLRLPMAPAAGTLLVFRAETTHEVTPVTRGERFTIVTWFR